MGNLLINILAIALFGILALYAGSYIGDALKDRAASANAAGLIAQGSQIQGAFDAARLDGESVTSITVAQLANSVTFPNGTYLDQEPQFEGVPYDLAAVTTVDDPATDGSVPGNYIKMDVSKDICDEVVERTGGAISGDATTLGAHTGLISCVVSEVETAANAGDQVYQFGYKVRSN